MTNHLGNEGQIKIGSNFVAELRSATVTEEANTVDDTTCGDEWETHKTSQKKWSAAVECFWDEGDAAQTAMAVGASVTFSYMPEGSTNGDAYRTGTATVESVDNKFTHNGLVEASVKLKGNGALTPTTVGA